MIVGPADRPRLLTVSRILVGYGVVGLAVAALGLMALIIGLGRVNGLADRLRDDVGGVSTVLARTAVVLDDAAATAGGLGPTIESSATALGTAAADLREVVPRLREIEFQANAVNILGSQPLAPLAGLFGQIATRLDDLDVQLDTIAAGLGANRGAIEKNAASLAELADDTRALGERLGLDTLPAIVDDARWLLIAMLGIGTLGAVVPAGGALIAGVWLRRWLVRMRTYEAAPIEG